MTEENDAGDGVGEELARARTALGFSVADVAQQLKFSARQIEALEKGRFAELPTGTFGRGMVRSYARLLRLDPEPLVQRIAGRTATPDNAAAVASVRRPIPITDSTRRTNLIYAALSLAILVIIGGVVFEWQRERSSAARMTFVPAAAQAPLQTTQAPAATSPAPQQVAAATPNQVPLQPAEQPATPDKAAAAAPQAAATQPAAPKAGTRRIQIKFERESWVEIRGRDGKILTSELNPGGTEKVVDGSPPFTLIIGNAHHVKLSYDDRPIDLAPHVKVEVARFTLD
jgi:cytoskeleton protein RodZ